MNRRKFIKRASGLIVPATFGIFVPKLKAQAFTWRDPAWVAKISKPVASGGGGSTIWATSVSLTSPGFQGTDGLNGIGRGTKITIGASDITVTDLGCFAFSNGFETTIAMQIYNSSCVAITGATASPNISANDSLFHYAAVATPPTLTAGSVYFIMAKAYYWWYDAIYTTTSSAAANDGVDGSASTCALSSLASGHGHGPINFKYT